MKAICAGADGVEWNIVREDSCGSKFQSWKDFLRMTLIIKKTTVELNIAQLSITGNKF